MEHRVQTIAQLRSGLPTYVEKAKPDLPDEYVVDDGDLVFSWSGSLMVKLWCGGRAALNQHLFKVTSADLPKWFYLGWTKFHLDEFKRIAADKAVTMGHIKRSHLREAACVLPDAESIGKRLGDDAFVLDKRLMAECLRTGTHAAPRAARSIRRA